MSPWARKAMSPRLVAGLATLAACAAPPPSPRGTAPRAAEATSPVAPARPTTPPQVFSGADPGFTFADPDRRQKLIARVPAIDAALTAEMARQKLPGFAIGIVIDDELAYAKGFGVRDLETKAPPDGDTVYRIGSITKSFTGLALLVARDDGKLQLDDPLVRWIPEAGGLIYPSRDARPITLRQMHSHTSGLPRVGAFNVDTEPTEATVVQALSGARLEFAPGTGWRYSNFAFSLLGIVAGRATGVPFQELVAQRIFRPLQMTSTAWTPEALPPERLAPTYGDKPPERATPARRGAASGAGGIFSTVRDLGRYVALQLSAYPPRDERDDGPIRRATLREAHATGVQASSWARLESAPKPGDYLVAYNASTYGSGWIQEQSCEFDDLIWHNGSIDSFRSDLAFLPTRGVGVVVLTNFPDGDPSAIRQLALRELLRTGALAKRVARPAPALLDALPKLIAVQNQWDDAAYTAMVDAQRPVKLEEERTELATYRALHGRCESFTPVEVFSSSAARFKVECERGTLTFDVGVSPQSGKITGFIGRSTGIAAPAELRKQADAIASLIGRWDDGLHQRLLAKTRRSRAEAKAYFGDLRTDHGACRITTPVHLGFEWRMELACDRGGGMTLELSLHDRDPAALEDYDVRFTEPGCPKR